MHTDIFFKVLNWTMVSQPEKKMQDLITLPKPWHPNEANDKFLLSIPVLGCPQLQADVPELIFNSFQKHFFFFSPSKLWGLETSFSWDERLDSVSSEYICGLIWPMGRMFDTSSVLCYCTRGRWRGLIYRDSVCQGKLLSEIHVG